MTDVPDPVVVPPDRGKTTISERVLRKIAEYDAGRHHGVVAARRVRARHHDRHVDIRMGLTLAYPMPAAETAHGVRLRVMSALRRFTGYEVTDVDIMVSYERR